jgi:hypothetical protein
MHFENVLQDKRDVDKNDEEYRTCADRKELIHTSRGRLKHIDYDIEG